VDKKMMLLTTTAMTATVWVRDKASGSNKHQRHFAEFI
jgi:hypothetical protein